MQSGRSHGFGRSLPRLVAAIVLACGGGVCAQTTQPFQLQVDTNLVVVRVVVRDGQGRPVGGLRKEDFRLLDNRKASEITGFAVETSDEYAAPASARSAITVGAASVPQRFIALYFDDLHMEFGDLGNTRNAAWRYVSTKLHADERVAIFTSSNQGGVDFTDDRDKLHDALFRLTPHSRTIPLMNECPAMGEYQAFLIDERADQHVLDLAAQEGAVCHCQVQGDCTGHDERHEAMAKAAQIRSLAEVQAQDALDVAEGVVRRLAVMPGQRNLVLVSAGFLTGTLERRIGALIDRALRQNVVINAMDAAGLYTKANSEPINPSNPHLRTELFMLENEGLSVQRDVLAGLAAGTGGAFFQNSNDFDEGFGLTARIPEVTYVLSFSPADVKLDGRFHTLKVTVQGRRGLEVQARRGYFANAANAATGSAKGEFEGLVFSQEERQELPATVTARAGGSAVTVKIHVDIQALQFHNEADRSMATLIFKTALFDRDGKYVTGKDSSLNLRLTEARLAQLRQSGVNAETSFRIRPGAYRVREIVRDAASQKLAALNCNVEIAALPRNSGSMK